MNKLKIFYGKHTLGCILAVAFVLRLLSVMFAKGFGMHDDHFLIIETSRSWASGWDFQDWLKTSPQGHSFTYPLLMYFLFKILMFFGVENLNIQMYIIRLLHAMFSLLTIFLSYKIVMRTTNEKKQATITAWILSLLWCMPWLSVRNLVEITCIPFLLYSTWFYIRNQQPDTKDVLFSGIMMGIAFAFRFQVIFFIGGFGLAMLIGKQWKNAVIWSLSLLAVFSLTQISDIFIWHKPFAEMAEYIRYNFFNSGEYPQGGFFKYIGVILVVLVPPVSLMLLFGFFYNWKKLYLFLPSFCFLLFHSLFPNKQERFIFPILPFIVILGVIGCFAFYNKYPVTVKQRKIIRVCVIISLVINFIMLIPVTVHYSKKARVESMVYMGKYAPDVNSYLIDNQPDKDILMMPKTYLGQYCLQYNVVSDTIDMQKVIYNPEPSFILFVSDKDLNKRLNFIKQRFPNLEYETTITPSFLDDLMRKINRHNKNYPFIIYRNTDIIQNKK